MTTTFTTRRILAKDRIIDNVEPEIVKKMAERMQSIIEKRIESEFYAAVQDLHVSGKSSVSASVLLTCPHA